MLHGLGLNTLYIYLFRLLYIIEIVYTFQITSDLSIFMENKSVFYKLKAKDAWMQYYIVLFFAIFRSPQMSDDINSKQIEFLQLQKDSLYQQG